MKKLRKYFYNKKINVFLVFQYDSDMMRICIISFNTFKGAYTRHKTILLTYTECRYTSQVHK